jgi:hypothetical protein
MSGENIFNRQISYENHINAKALRGATVDQKALASAIYSVSPKTPLIAESKFERDSTAIGLTPGRSGKD